MLYKIIVRCISDATVKIKALYIQYNYWGQIMRDKIHGEVFVKHNK